MIVIQTKNVKELARKMTNMAKEFALAVNKPKEINDVLYRAGNNMRNYIITEMRNTERAPWSYRKTKSGKRHHPSMPGHYPAIDTGEGVRSVAFDTSVNAKGVALEIGSNAGAPYLEHLETRKDRSKRRPWLDPTVKHFEKDILNDLEAIVPGNVGEYIIKAGRK